ncbi:hypothetical protein GXY_00688 [Novacetimonas hansenii ATCC 23769]|uniref:Uncharacterized protein n=1 Tax=Novacetimonas hansenii ATCC 23769 TaxID=714995 RepID=D5QAL8_NOVHA|nr:hypothetical protein GXY_00688 [Novacetimonas hansenii ATCC 23769]
MTLLEVEYISFQFAFSMMKLISFNMILPIGSEILERSKAKAL